MHRTRAVVRISLLVFGVLVVLSCMSAPATASGPKKTIILDQSLQAGSSMATAAWLSYAAHISADMDAFYSTHPTTDEYVVPFEVEKSARLAMSTTWQQLKKDYPRETDSYLDDLGRIVAAGFISEYLYAYYRKATWLDDPVLRTAEFNEWYSFSMKDHKPATLARVVLAGQ